MSQAFASLLNSVDRHHSAGFSPWGASVRETRLAGQPAGQPDQLAKSRGWTVCAKGVKQTLKQVACCADETPTLESAMLHETRRRKLTNRVNFINVKREVLATI